MLLDTFKTWLQAVSSPPARRRSRTRRGHLNVEPLESRVLLSSVDATGFVAERGTDHAVYMTRSIDGRLRNQYLFTLQPAEYGSEFHAGDFNGDGLDDLALFGMDSKWRVALADGTSMDPPTEWGQVSGSVSYLETLVDDFNGDGYDDIAMMTSAGVWNVGVSDGSGNLTFNQWTTWASSIDWIHVATGDFNGDDKADIAGLGDDGSVIIAESYGSSFFSSTKATVAPSSVADWRHFLVGNFNGDSYDDIALMSDLGVWEVLTSDGTGFTQGVWDVWSATTDWQAAFVGDFNGDGLDDLTAFGRETDPLGNSTARWEIGISNGIGGFAAHTVAGYFSASGNWSSFAVGDFDRDGKTDVVSRDLDTGQWWVGLSNGLGGINTSHWGTWIISGNWQNITSGRFIA